MEKRDYIGSAFSSLATLKNKPSLYIPDLVFFIATAVISLLFLSYNSLTSIFTGGISIFNSQLKNILSSTPSLLKFVISFLVLGMVNLVIGLTTLTMRFTMIKNTVKGNKFTVFSAWKEYKKYILSLFILKVILLVVYFVPLLVLIGIGILYKQLLLIMVFVLLIVYLVFKFVFLFSYPVLFIDNVKNPIKVIRKAVDYFGSNRLHSIIVGLFVLLVGLIMTVVLNIFPILWSKAGVYLFGPITLIPIIYLVVKTLIDVTVNLWMNLFVFKNYT